MTTKRLVIEVTAGPDAPERCRQGFTVAVTALAAGIDVSVWLTGDAAVLALPGRAPEIQPATGTELSDLLATVLAGGQVTVSAPSAELHGLSEVDVVDGVRIGSVPAFVDEVTAESTQALVY
jgi:predicted peroxiredoxin